MKFSFKNLFISCMMLLCTCTSFNNVFAQGGTTTGSWPPDVELLQKCLDSSNLGTNYISFYELQTHRIGFATTIVYYRGNGATFTPPAGTQTIGSCPATVTLVKDSLREIVLLALCDQSSTTYTPFWRVVQRTYWPTTGAGVFQTIATIGSTGLPYTPSGTIYDSPCAVWDYPATETVSEITSNVSYSAHPYESWSVSNMGTTLITVTVGAGSAVNLYPGETRGCSTLMDFNTHKMKMCSTFSVNAASGTAHVYVRSKL